MNGTDITYRRAAALLVPVLLLLAFLAIAMVPAALAQSPPAAPGAPGPVAAAAPAKHGGGEANLIVPDLGQARFVGMNGRTLLQFGLIVCVLGLIFGLVIYGQLKNLIDLAIAAAFIQKQDYYSQAGWKMELFRDEQRVPIEIFEAPKTVETACTAKWKGNRLMTPVGGGVQMQPQEAIQSSRLLKDDGGALKAARTKVTVDGLAKGQWWWD